MLRSHSSAAPAVTAHSVLSGRPITVAWNDAPSGLPSEPANDAGTTVEALGRRVAKEGPLPPEQVVPMVRQAAAALAADQAAGRYLDTRSQVYWLGGVLFFALTGKVPFQTLNTARRNSPGAAEPPSPSTLSPHAIHPLLDVIVRTCLAARTDRFSSAHELEAALGSVPLSHGASLRPAVGLDYSIPPFSAAPAALEADDCPPTQRNSGVEMLGAIDSTGELRRTG